MSAGIGTKTRSPCPADNAERIEPRNPWEKTREGAIFTVSPSVEITFNAWPCCHVPSSTLTSNNLSPSRPGRSAKAQPRKADRGEKPISLTGEIPISCKIWAPSLAGKKECNTSCKASTPKPLFAEPATKGATFPAATARCNAASIMIRGTSPSNSIKASIISSSTAAKDSICCSLNFLAHVASSPAALPSETCETSEHPSAEQIEPSRTFNKWEPSALPLKCAGAKSTTGRTPRRFSNASSAASKCSMSSASSTPFKKTTAGFPSRSTAAKLRPQAASTPLRAETTSTAPCAAQRARSTRGARSTWPGVSMRCSLALMPSPGLSWE
mmetsp:Transcript_14438/g.36454  ORF Transcript_14438/g.36454 Transcript_14438/m.36454 type:complete len:327 (-) Transcript_14438:278-1258(-)